MTTYVTLTPEEHEDWLKHYPRPVSGAFNAAATPRQIEHHDPSLADTLISIGRHNAAGVVDSYSVREDVANERVIVIPEEPEDAPPAQPYPVTDPTAKAEQLVSMMSGEAMATQFLAAGVKDGFVSLEDAFVLAYRAGMAAARRAA
jgi:hypothetical protein